MSEYGREKVQELNILKLKIQVVRIIGKNLKLN